MSIEVLTVRFRQADGEVVNFDNQTFWSCTAFLRPRKFTVPASKHATTISTYFAAGGSIK